MYDQCCTLVPFSILRNVINWVQRKCLCNVAHHCALLVILYQNVGYFGQFHLLCGSAVNCTKQTTWVMCNIFLNTDYYWLVSQETWFPNCFVFIYCSFHLTFCSAAIQVSVYRPHVPENLQPNQDTALVFFRASDPVK